VDPTVSNWYRVYGIEDDECGRKVYREKNLDDWDG
jgi:hypothetical protein